MNNGENPEKMEKKVNLIISYSKFQQPVYSEMNPFIRTDAKAKAATGKKSKKKWSKGKSRDKLQNMCLFDKPTYDKVMKEVLNYKV